MTVALYGLAFVLGTIIGSFLNVLVLRFKTGETVHGRSRCMSCGRKLAWYELIPVVSFLLQHGRCRNCNSRISIQYPLVEMTMGLVFFGIAYMLRDYEYLPMLISFKYFGLIGALCIAISAYDILHKIIPNAFVYTLTGVSVVSLFFNFETLTTHMPSLWHVLAGPILWLPFAFLWAISKGQWIGLGDAKLAWAFGWVLGLWGGISAVIFGFWAGALYGIGALLFSKFRFVGGGRELTMKSELPLGPFLVFGFLVVLIGNITIHSFIF